MIWKGWMRFNGFDVGAEVWLDYISAARSPSLSHASVADLHRLFG